MGPPNRGPLILGKPQFQKLQRQDLLDESPGFAEVPRSCSLVSLKVNLQFEAATRIWVPLLSVHFLRIYFFWQIVVVKVIIVD